MYKVLEPLAQVLSALAGLRLIFTHPQGQPLAAHRHRTKVLMESSAARDAMNASLCAWIGLKLAKPAANFRQFRA